MTASQISLAEFAAAAANKVKIMFSRDMCAGKHTAQAASVLFVRQSGQMARAAACKPFVEKPRKGVFDSLRNGGMSMLSYQPEGLKAQPIPAPDVLHLAGGSREIFQAMCIKCDEFHNLVVDLGSIRGLIPRQEAALGIAEGREREIAILSRVGKPLCFQVLGFSADGTALLSRRAAQAEARAYLLRTLQPGQILPAVVQNVTPFGAFCDIGCGVTALMSIERCSVSRITHCSQRFSPGQKIYAAILSVDPARGRIQLTGRELLGTWEENVAQFRPGQAVPGIVRGVKPYGIFVELTPNLSGLAEPGGDWRMGQGVSVYLRSILPERQKIKLTILEGLPAVLAQPLRYYRTAGRLERWEYAPGSAVVTVF